MPPPNVPISAQERMKEIRGRDLPAEYAAVRVIWCAGVCSDERDHVREPAKGNAGADGSHRTDSMAAYGYQIPFSVIFQPFGRRR